MIPRSRTTATASGIMACDSAILKTPHIFGDINVHMIFVFADIVIKDCFDIHKELPRKSVRGSGYRDGLPVHFLQRKGKVHRFRHCEKEYAIIEMRE